MTGSFLQKFTLIIESGIGGMNSFFLMSALLLYTTKPSWRQLIWRQFLMKFGIFLNIYLLIYFPSSLCLIGKTQGKNNICMSCLNSTEQYVDPNSLYQLQTHANTVLRVLINLMYPRFQHYQWLCLYIIPSYQTHESPCFLSNKLL